MMRDVRSVKPFAVFVIALAALGVLVFVDLPDTLASPARQEGVCGCDPPYWNGIYCCRSGSVSMGDARCTSWCWIDYPGGPTTTPVNTLTSPERTSWAATVDARATLGIEATQTRLAGESGYVCFSCYNTGECPSGWGEACFYNEGLKGYLYPVSLTCQSAAECEPTEGPGEEECVPGWAWTPEVSLDPCEGWEWTWDLRVRAIVPPHLVQVDPFPRWLVGMGAPLPAPYESGEPGTVTLQDYPSLTNFLGACQPNADSEGCWSQKNNKPDPIRTDPETGEEAPLPGDIKDFRHARRCRSQRRPGDLLGLG
jgi:hypothetical protein